jgi:hypothetical protein
MKIIAESPWSYVLFEDHRGCVLTVAGRSGGADLSIRLSEAETGSARRDPVFVRKLVAEIQAEPARFEARRLEQVMWPKAR